MPDGTFLMDVEASLVEGVAGIGECVVHRSFADAEDAQPSTNRSDWNLRLCPACFQR